MKTRHRSATDAKKADDDGGVLYCGKRIRTVPDGMKPGGLSLQQDQTEFVKARCEPANMPEPEPNTREPRVQRAKFGTAKCDTESALRNGRNTSGRVVRDQSITSAPFKL